MFKDEGEKDPTRENALQIYAGDLTNQGQNPLALVMGTSNLTEADLVHMGHDTLGMDDQYQLPKVLEFFRKTKHYLELEMTRRKEAEGLEDPFTQLDELLVAEIGSTEIAKMDKWRKASTLKDLEEAREALQKRETEIRTMVLARFHQCWWREDLREETSYNVIVPNMIQMFSVVREEESKKPTYIEGTYLYTKLAPSNYSSFLGACTPAMRALGLGKTVEEIASMNLAWQEKGPAMPDIPILGVSGVFGRVTHLSGKFFMNTHNDGHYMNFGVAFSEDALRRIILCRPLFTPR